ncbi:beta-ketoacyl synthase N-terminal-like domain-containing protein [Longispora albida]|uniref:beta-ketoacyl synthase N-terminal-like domain-containing protein n=1 Tax=Longispora albida TaxID=203523 RepID=UPI0004758708|nr:beta-ketoacyl synthase N-terminal-like domain-containing protein [Longispora albida]
MTAGYGNSERVVITAWSAISPFGIGRSPFLDGLRSGRPVDAPLDSGDWPQVPYSRACLVPGFVPREVLQRKGTRTMDRMTALAVATVGQVLQEDLAPVPGQDTGVVLAVTNGSVESVMDFVRTSLTARSPLHVNPGMAPRGVMNYAAGQCAIWYQLTGPNATIAGGRTGGLLGLNYARRLLTRGRAKRVLCGAAEEFSYGRSWVEFHSRDDHTLLLGEGAAVLSLESAATGGPELAEILAVESRVAVSGDFATAVDTSVEAVLARCGIRPADVWSVTTCGSRIPAVTDILNAKFTPAALAAVPSADILGDTGAVSGVFQIAAVLATAEQSPADLDRIALVVAVERDGTIACVALRLPGSSTDSGQAS